VPRTRGGAVSTDQPSMRWAVPTDAYAGFAPDDAHIDLARTAHVDALDDRSIDQGLRQWRSDWPIAPEPWLPPPRDS
jgi:hypothetical protein